MLYGAAEFSRDTDLALFASPDNLLRLQAALDALQAECIAVPPLKPKHFAHRDQPTDGQVAFWLMELRTPSLLLEVAWRFPQRWAEALPHRPLLHYAEASDEPALRKELAAKEQRECEAEGT